MLAINTNISSLSLTRYLSNSSNKLDSVLKQLSTGFRINSAKDDAAGLQVSTRLTSQIKSLDRANLNAMDAISVNQVADGAMDEVTSMLQRMRVLAVQAQNGINTDLDRAALNKEFQALKVEIDRVANTTTFGGIPLLQGNYEGTFLVGANGGENETVTVTDFDVRTQRLGYYGWDSRPLVTSASSVQLDHPTRSLTGYPRLDSGLLSGAVVNGHPIVASNLSALVTEVSGIPDAEITVEGRVYLNSNINIPLNAANTATSLPNAIHINGHEIRFDNIPDYVNNPDWDDPLHDDYAPGQNRSAAETYYYSEVRSTIEAGLPTGVNATFSAGNQGVTFQGSEKESLAVNGTSSLMPSISNGTYIPNVIIKTSSPSGSVSFPGSIPTTTGIERANNFAGLISPADPLVINGVSFEGPYNTSTDLMNAINNASYPANNSPVRAELSGNVLIRSSILPSELSSSVPFTINGQDIDLSNIPLPAANINNNAYGNYYRNAVMNELNNHLHGTGVTARIHSGGSSLSIELISSRDIAIEGTTPAGLPDLKVGQYVPQIELKSFGAEFTNLELASNNAAVLGFHLPDRVEALVDRADILTYESAAQSIEMLDIGISQVGEQRGNIGAMINRMQATTRSLSNTTEGLSAARARIRDTDYASATTALVKQQIIQQASVSLLTQANLRPQSVLSLLN